MTEDLDKQKTETDGTRTASLQLIVLILLFLTFGPVCMFLTLEIPLCMKLFCLCSDANVTKKTQIRRKQTVSFVFQLEVSLL